MLAAFFAFPAQLAAAGAPSPPFAFALIGDYPYFDRDYAAMPHLVEDIRSNAELEFVIHLGDVHNPRYTECSDAFFVDRLEVLRSLGHPFILTPGDNDWADCKGDAASNLQRIRRIFFAVPSHPNGPDVFAVRTQSEGEAFPDLVENAIWERNGVVFATLHMIAPGLVPFLDSAVDERSRLVRAGEVWLDEVFELAIAREARGVFLATQVSLWPLSGNVNLMEMLDPGLLDQPATFTNFKASLVGHVRAFGRPVALANGDSHFFRIDKPLFDANRETLQTFTRVEGFGSPHGHWVRVQVDPSRPEVFSFRQELVAENLFTLIAKKERTDGFVGDDLGMIRTVVKGVLAVPRLLSWIGAGAIVIWIARRFTRRKAKSGA
jgi:hypothetical protein